MLGRMGNTWSVPQSSYFIVREPSNSAWETSQPGLWTQTPPCRLSILPTRQVPAIPTVAFAVAWGTCLGLRVDTLAARSCPWPCGHQPLLPADSLRSSMGKPLPSPYLPSSVGSSTANTTNTVCLFTLPNGGVRLQEVAVGCAQGAICLVR